MVPLAAMLPALPSVMLTVDGVARVGRGQDVRLEARQSGEGAAGARPGVVRLMNPSGELIAIAQLMPGSLLHPSIVLV
jgi:hypothetical protein